MRHFNRLIALALLLSSSTSFAMSIFVEAFNWRPTETNDWVYVNSLTVPQQTIGYKTIDFNYSTGVRAGVIFNSYLDTLLSYTSFKASTNDSAVGNLQPAFSGSVTAKPAPSYLYSSGQVRQTIDFGMFDLHFSRAFTPATALTFKPYFGLMGGWINQTIFASYFGSTSAFEKITNNFMGLGPKVGIDTFIQLFDYNGFTPKLLVGFAASYLGGDWDVIDKTQKIPTRTIILNGASHPFGAQTFQAQAGLVADYKQLNVKLTYEINDWFNQNQFFDNDTGAHNNDLILQGLTLGLSYSFS